MKLDSGERNFEKRKVWWKKKKMSKSKDLVVVKVGWGCKLGGGGGWVGVEVGWGWRLGGGGGWVGVEVGWGWS